MKTETNTTEETTWIVEFCDAHSTSFLAVDSLGRSYWTAQREKAERCMSEATAQSMARRFDGVAVAA